MKYIENPEEQKINDAANVTSAFINWIEDLVASLNEQIAENETAVDADDWNISDSIDASWDKNWTYAKLHSDD